MKYFAALLLTLLCKTTFSQDLIENYYDFGGAITEGRKSDALVLADKILPLTSSLSPKRRAIFYYQLAGLHEIRKNTEQAIDFYERSLKLEPNYYVPHLALGYLYVSKVNILVVKINAEKINALLREKYVKEYKSFLRKALPHFEKAMACDSNDQVLASIKNAYGSLKDPASFNSLDSRLNELKKECVTVLVEH